MSAINETIVREYFELHGFLVRQDRKYEARGKQEIDGIDFFVWNPPTASNRRRPLPSSWIPRTCPPSTAPWSWCAAGTPNPSGRPSSKVRRKCSASSSRPFSSRRRAPSARILAPLKILIVPSLPQTAAAREQSIAILRAKGVDAVIPFRTMLADLIARAEVNRNYDKSDLLQVIRVLKNYQLFKDPQLELFRAARRARRPRRA